jgi:hypothetical protein
MAFHNKKTSTAILSDIMNYQQYLKSDDALKHYQTPEGFYLNITKIEQTPEEKEMSEKMEKFYNNYRDIINEKKDE